MVRACAHMHKMGIMHRDIKPENMLLSRNGILKVCDMGFARHINSSKPLTEYVSTRWYRAPELLIESAGYSSGIDIWAIGCIYVELLTGKPLFTGRNDYDMLKLILAMFQSSEGLP
jgi:cyclin-dependent kinase-like